MANTMKVRVRATAERGRWRIGRHFSREWTEVDVTDEQFAQLDADPVLAVEVAASDTARRDAIRKRTAAAKHPALDVPEEEKIHPVGNNLGAPPTTVPDTSETAARRRAHADDLSRQAIEQGMQRAPLPVKLVEGEEAPATASSDDKSGGGRSRK